MTINLTSEEVAAVSAKTQYKGRGTFSVIAGKSLKIETTPLGAELLDVKVPTGKQWTVNIRLSIVETDV